MFSNSVSFHSTTAIPPSFSPSPLVTLKLIIHKETQKLIFAEAGKDFVDFLFHIPSLPIGNLLSVSVNDAATWGSLGNLYNVIKNFNVRLMQTKHVANNNQSVHQPLRLSTIRDHLLPSQKNIQYHNQCSNSPFEAKNTTHFGATTNIDHTVCENSTDGYVKGNMTYLVMDDLTVKRMSTILVTSLLGEVDALDVTKLEEKEVEVGINEGVALLKESMVTHNVLTTVFLKKSSGSDQAANEEDYAMVA